MVKVMCVEGLVKVIAMKIRVTQMMMIMMMMMVVLMMVIIRNRIEHQEH